MTVSPIDLAANAMVGVTRDSITALRGALFRDVGPNAAAFLQEAGYAGGAQLFTAFAAWLDARGLGTPEELPATDFGPRATEFFVDMGWGSFELGTLHGAVATIDSHDWAEAEPASALEFPGCHVTTGMFADFFGRLAGNQLAVMEVECRSMGAERCRFLIGSAEVMQHLYDAMAQGVAYDVAAETVG